MSSARLRQPFGIGRLQRWRAGVLTRLILPHVRAGERVLDFGCGNLLMATELSRIATSVSVVGLDVVGAPLSAERSPGSPARVLYDGTRIPFADKSFDCAYAAFVLHHTRGAPELVRELLRVTRRQVVLLEDVYHSRFELELLKLFDRGNLLSSRAMDLPFTFRTEPAWVATALAAGAIEVQVLPIRPAVPKPTRHRAFVLT